MTFPLPALTLTSATRAVSLTDLPSSLGPILGGFGFIEELVLNQYHAGFFPGYLLNQFLLRREV